jgi:hypothetical protein
MRPEVADHVVHQRRSRRRWRSGARTANEGRGRTGEPLTSGPVGGLNALLASAATADCGSRRPSLDGRGKRALITSAAEGAGDERGVDHDVRLARQRRYDGNSRR